MTLYCGIDLHSNNSVVAVLDEQDRTVYEKRLPNDIATITEVLCITWPCAGTEVFLERLGRLGPAIRSPRLDLDG
jgi:hypothetical protein